MGILYGREVNPGRVPSLDLRFKDRGNLKDTINGNIEVNVSRTQDTQSTYFGSDGLIKYAAVDEARFDHDPATGESLGLLIEESRTNRIRYGNEPPRNANVNNSIFEYNYELAPDGTFTAVRWRPPSGLVDPGSSAINTRFYRSINSSAGDVVTRSVYVKPIQTISRYINPPDTTEEDRDVYLHLYSDQGNVGYVNLTTLTPSAGVTVQPVANGWYKVSGTYTVLNNDVNDNQFLTISNRTGISFDPYPTGDEEVLIWGHQVETGSFPTSYIPTPATFTSRASEATYYDQNGIVSTASTDVARDDAYFPDENGNFISAGLLLEGERTNLFPYSEDLSNSAIFTSASFTSTTELDVTGGSNACILTEDTTVSSVHRFNGYFTAWQTTGVHSYKFFAKPNGRTKCQVSRRTSFIDDFTHIFTLTGIGSATGGGSISKLPNDWYELTGSFNVNNTSNTGINFFLMDDLQNITYDGDGTSGMIIFGKQIEEGSYATSYIPTTSGISTRAADISSSGISTRGADDISITNTDLFSKESSTI